MDYSSIVVDERTETFETYISRLKIDEELRAAIDNAIFFKFNDNPNSHEDEDAEGGNTSKQQQEEKPLTPLRYLPENPFYEICRYMAPLEQKQLLWNEENTTKLQKRLQNDLNKYQDKFLEITFKGDTDSSHSIYLNVIDRDASRLEFWGLPSLVEWIDGKNLARVGNFMLTELASQPPEKPIKENEAHKVEIIPSLAGPYLFYRNIIPCPREFIMTEDYIISGPTTEMAMNTFIQYIAGDLIRMQKSKKFVSIIIMFIELHGREQKITKMWTLDDIKTKGKLFKSEMKSSIIEKRKIVAKTIARFDTFPTAEEPRVFEFEKYYTLTIVADGEPPLSFMPRPLDTIYHGVFLSREHAEAYVKLISNLLTVEEKEQYEELNKMVLKREVKRLHAKGTATDWCYPLLLYALHSGYPDLVLEIVRLTNAVEAKINEFTKTLLNIQFIIDKFSAEEAGKVNWYLNPARDQFPLLRDMMIKLFKSREHSYLEAMAGAIETLLDEITELKSGNIILAANTHAILQQLSDYCYAISKTMGEETLRNSPATESLLYEIIKEIKELEEEEKKQQLQQKQPQQQEKKEKRNTKRGKKEEPKEKEKEEPEAVEEEKPEDDAEDPIYEQKVIDVEWQKRKLFKRKKIPTYLINEGVLMQYIKDTGLYEAMYEMLASLVHFGSWKGVIGSNVPGAGELRANPYPDILRYLQGLSLKHSYFKDNPKDWSISNFCIKSNAQYGVYRLQNEDGSAKVFGMECALFSLDYEKVESLFEFIEPILNKSKITAGAYQLYVSNAVDCTDFMMGRNLSNLDIQQDYFVEGPKLNNAVDIFCSDLVKHFIHLTNNKLLIVDALYINFQSRVPKVITLEHINTDRTAVVLEIREAVYAQNPDIYVKGYAQYMNKFYIPFMLDIKFHFVNVEKHKTFSFQKINELTLLTNVYDNEQDVIKMINLMGMYKSPLKDEKLLDRVNGQLIEEISFHMARGDYIEAYRWILLHCKINKNSNKAGEQLIQKIFSGLLMNKLGDIYFLERLVSNIITIMRSKNKGKVNDEIIRQNFTYYVEEVRKFIYSTGFVFFDGVKTKIEATLKHIERVIKKQKGTRLAFTEEDINKIISANNYLKCSRVAIVSSIHHSIFAKDVQEFLEKYLTRLH